MDAKELEAIKARLAAATPGPWYDHNPDDDYCMNAYTVTNSPVEPDVGVDERTNDHKHIIALTLLQTPRVACHEDSRWEENARFIAHAPTDIAALLAEVERVTTERDSYKSALGDIAWQNLYPHMAQIAQAALDEFEQ
jgi:hypothetical protein